MLLPGMRGVKPVVGDVVEGAPAGAVEQRRRGWVVHPEQRVSEAQPIGTTNDLLGQPRVRVRVEPTGKRLGALMEPESAVGHTVEPGSTPQPRATPRPGATARVVDRVGRRLDEEDPQVGIVAQQPRDEVLVPAPHAVPGLEGSDDEVPAGPPRHSRLRYTASVARSCASRVNLVRWTSLRSCP